MVKRLALWLTSGVAAMLVSGATLVPLASAAQVFNVDIPIVNEVVDNPCNGESVTVNGVMHELLDTVDTPIGGDIVVDVLTSKDLTGSGSYGNTYRVALTDLSVLTSQDPAATLTELATYEVISQGPAPNFRITLVFHLTFANGDIVSDVEIVSETCTG